MKICFLLQRRFAYVGHYLAQYLKEKYGIKDFCAYVYRRQSFDFLKNQTDIHYSSLLLDEEIQKEYEHVQLDHEFLQKLEKDYGLPFLWPYVYIDRILRFGQLVREYPYDQTKFSHQDLMKMVQVRAKKIIAMLEKEKPDFLICSVVGGMGSLLLYHIAKKMGVKVYVICPARVGTRQVLSEHFARFTDVEKVFDVLSQKNALHPRYAEAEKLLEEFRKRPETYEKTLKFYVDRANRLKQMDFLSPKKLKNYFIWLFRVIRENFRTAERGDYSYVHPWGKVKDQIRRKLRNMRGVSDLYDDFNPQEPFAFFPLHLEPEITTLLYAPYHTDQLHIAKQIARSLPYGFTLYVKEQPAMVDFRPRKFYTELKKVPNIKLLDPRVSSFDIIPHAKIITTITGTAGWEGLFLKKPVVSIGEVYYNKLTGMVKQCRAIEDLPFLIKEQLEHFQYDEKALINFLACVLDDSVDVNIGYLWEKETDQAKKRSGLEPMADYLAKKFKISSGQKA